MFSFTVTQLQRQMSEVLNTVQSQGAVEIKNRQRPDMVLITADQLNALVEKKAKQLLENSNA